MDVRSWSYTSCRVIQIQYLNICRRPIGVSQLFGRQLLVRTVILLQLELDQIRLTRQSKKNTSSTSST